MGGRVTLRLDPGTWVLGVDAPGFRSLRRTILVGDGPETVELRLVPVPVAVAVPVGLGPELGRARKERVAGAVLLPLGAVALGGVVASAVLYRDTRRAYQALGVDGYRCNELGALADLRTRARGATAAMVGLGVTSGALLSAGAVLLVRGQRTLRRARVAFDVRPGRVGLVLSGRF